MTRARRNTTKRVIARRRRLARVRARFIRDLDKTAAAMLRGVPAEMVETLKSRVIAHRFPERSPV